MNSAISKLLFGSTVAVGLVTTSNAAALVFGDMDKLGTGTYAITPYTGATTEGLQPGQFSFGTFSYSHDWPFAPGPGDYPGTDRIYVGSSQTAAHDGYSGAAERVSGPLVISMDYTSLVPVGMSVTSLTLGIMADDFQNPSFNQPYVARINGQLAPALTALLNGIDQTGPVARYFAIGLDLSFVNAAHTLELSIDQGGDGGDGFAIDFVELSAIPGAAVPEPAETAALVGAGLVLLAVGRRYLRRS